MLARRFRLAHTNWSVADGRGSGEMLAKLIIPLVGCSWSWVGGDAGQAAKACCCCYILFVHGMMDGRFIGCRFIDSIY